MIYIFKKHNGESYSRITHSKKACFNYFIKLIKITLIICVYIMMNGKLSVLLVVIITYMNF